MTGYFNDAYETKLLIAKQDLQTSTLKLEQVEADLHNNPNFVAKQILRLRKYQLTNIKEEAKAIIEEMEK